MKVLYDISVLGRGHYSARGRTGIFRVIENLAHHLSRADACDLSFYADQTLVHVVQTLKYLESNPAFQGRKLRILATDRTKKIVKRLFAMYPPPSKKLHSLLAQNMLSGILYGVSVMANTMHQDIFNNNTQALDTADVYHATYYPLPRTSGRTWPQRFITIYDVIAVLFPEYFTRGKNHLIHSILQSIRPGDWILAISQSTKNDLCNYLSFDPERVFVTHLAASAAFYRVFDRTITSRIRTKYGIPDTPYVLSVSTLEPRKNIDHTIRCFAKLVEEEHIRELSLVLVGTKGWDYDKILRELAGSSSLASRIIVTGYVPDEDLAPLYSGALMFVYPSYYEGFGLPPLEAMQCGVPVITSNTSSLPEVVGDAGIMLDPNDADALCQSMLDIYSKPSRYAELSALSLERAKLFSWSKCAQDTIAAYRTAVKGAL